MRGNVFKTGGMFLAVGAMALMAVQCARHREPRDAAALSASDPKWVAATLKKMNLEEKVGQMICCRISGNFFNIESDAFRELETLVRDRKIGGLLIYQGEAYETAFLLNRLQKAARVPLLVASDIERGTGSQIGGATLFPPFMAFGASGSADLAYRMGKATAVEGRAMGIHMAYAPVADVNVNPENPIINTRSAGESPEDVGRLAGAFIKGCQENGMIATAKHFPGHGDTALDSHSLLPRIEGDRPRLDRVELYPFRKAIEAGVQAVMTAHLHVPALDPTPGLPATLSPAILTGVLRRELGFKGLIVTDALIMGGVGNAKIDSTIFVKAVQAGADVLLMPPDPASAVQAVMDAVRQGRIAESRIDESVQRILEAKSRLGLHRNRYVVPEAVGLRVGATDFTNDSMEAFEKAVTLVKNENSVLPLPSPGKKVALFSLSSDPGDYYAGKEFAENVIKRSPWIQVFYADGDTGQESLDASAARAAGSGAVIVAMFSRLSSWKGSVDVDPKHIALVKRLAEGGAPVIVVSFGSPYFLKHFPEIDAYLCLYRNAPQTQEIAARAVFGEIDILGRLPVTLPGLYPLGHGLVLRKKNPPPF